MEAQIPQLLWHGHETLQVARRAAASRSSFELQLPADFHHALSVRLGTTRGAPAERVDRRGGPELLEALSRLRGLESLASLAADIGAGGRVHVLSPSPIVRVSFATTGAEDDAP